MWIQDTEDKSLQFAHWTRKPDYFSCVNGLCVLTWHPGVNGAAVDKDSSYTWVRLAPSRGQSAQALPKEV